MDARDAAGPVVGWPAPDFELRDQHGTPVRLWSLRGRRAVALVFFPWAFTGICTGELCAIRDRLPELDNDETALLAVSCDARASLRAYADQECYAFPLLSDHWPHGAVARAYGVFDERAGAARRGTVVIDRAGIVRWAVVNAIPDARDLAETVAALAAAGATPSR